MADLHFCMYPENVSNVSNVSRLFQLHPRTGGPMAWPQGLMSRSATVSSPSILSVIGATGAMPLCTRVCVCAYMYG